MQQADNTLMMQKISNTFKPNNTIVTQAQPFHFHNITILSGTCKHCGGNKYLKMKEGTQQTFVNKQ